MGCKGGENSFSGDDSFSGGLDWKGSGRSGSETGGIPVPQVQLSAVILSGSMAVPVFWGKYSKGVPILLTHKEAKEKLIIRTSRADGLVKLCFKVSKAVAS